MVRLALAALLGMFASVVLAVEVSSIVSCKPEGERWLCAAYQNDQIHVYRSDFYQTKVEFKGEVATESGPTKPATAPLTEAPVMSMTETNDGLPEGRYTVQLLACTAIGCEQRIKGLQGISGSQVVELKVNDKLMKILIVGGYPSYKDAQRAAADLMTRYQIADKPWIRTIESVQKNMLRN